MAFKLNQPEQEDTPRPHWAPMRLRGLPELQLSYHFDRTQIFDSTDALETLVLSVRIEPRGQILKYGISRWDLGSAWDDENQAEHRLKNLVEDELRKDLFLLHDKKKVPCSFLRIVWIDSEGRAIP
jgi:hypothetical protein